MATFNELQAQTQEIREAIASGSINSASAVQLAKYVQWLAQPAMGGNFAGHEFPQVCETVRLHMLRSMIEGFEQRGKTMQWWVLVLAVAALIASIVQTAVAIRAEARATNEADRAAQTKTEPSAPGQRAAPVSKQGIGAAR
jgi:hypothetical protein